MVFKERDFVIKEKDALKTQFDIISKENKRLHISLNKCKKNFISHTSHVNIASSSSSIDKNRFVFWKL